MKKSELREIIKKQIHEIRIEPIEKPYIEIDKFDNSSGHCEIYKGNTFIGNMDVVLNNNEFIKMYHVNYKQDYDEEEILDFTKMFKKISKLLDIYKISYKITNNEDIFTFEIEDMDKLKRYFIIKFI